MRPSLPFRDTQSHLRDILDSVNNIELFVGNMDFDAYRNDRKTKSAVERELQIITEAAIRLGDGEPSCGRVANGDDYDRQLRYAIYCRIAK